MPNRVSFAASAEEANYTHPDHRRQHPIAEFLASQRQVVDFKNTSTLKKNEKGWQKNEKGWPQRFFGVTQHAAGDSANLAFCFSVCFHHGFRAIRQ
ncbi:hypothetical protein ACFSQE_08240 [Vogesella fluminis]|uniref:hypothetical protein n=1 Tax=Vogesella fluminis TaxID=1069161 RepID=UPI003644C5C3